MTWPYEDIVNLPHHVSSAHPPMEMSRRAAQFAPFAALVGYGDAVAETARRTDEWIEPDENILEELDRRLAEAEADGREIALTYFAPDGKKDGGAYRTVRGRIRKTETGVILLDDGERIPVKQVTGIENAVPDDDLLTTT